jgi:RNA polymerase sigma-70 factor (ECF subfamily)
MTLPARAYPAENKKTMEGSMGTAIMEATLPGADFEPEGNVSGMSEIDRLFSGYPQTPLEEADQEDQVTSEGMKHQSEAFRTFGRTEYIPQPLKGDSATASLDSSPSSADATGPSDQPGIPPAPGAALLLEFDAIHQKYERRVYRQCFRMLRSQEDAEDLTQEVFLQLYRKAHTFRGESNFSTWLHRLTINTVLMRLRRNRRWRDSVTSLDIAPGSLEDIGDVLSLVTALPAPPVSTVDKISLDVAIAQLSSGYRQVFLLHDSEGYRHDEIARILGISEGTSKSQLHKARFKLRELIESSPSRNASLQHDARVCDGRTQHPAATTAEGSATAGKYANLANHEDHSRRKTGKRCAASVKTIVSSPAATRRHPR